MVIEKDVKKYQFQFPGWFSVVTIPEITSLCIGVGTGGGGGGGVNRKAMTTPFFILAYSPHTDMLICTGSDLPHTDT